METLRKVVLGLSLQPGTWERVWDGLVDGFGDGCAMVWGCRP